MADVNGKKVDLKRDHPGFVQQELWTLFEKKAKEEHGEALVTAVEEVCGDALALANDINRFFPKFTLHDEHHSARVCEWMYALLGEHAEELTALEVALLVMAACCHDIGMAVSPAQEAQMRLRTYRGWDEYFRKNLGDAEEFDRTKTISDRMLRNFVRQRHHERIEEHDLEWPDILVMKGITEDDFLELCRSHGTGLSREKLTYKKKKYDLLLCAVLLRLADLLDYDISRSPQVLFRHLGLGHPRNEEELQSAEEHLKNQAGGFDKLIVDGILRYTATYDHPEKEQKVRGYLDMVQQELDYCAKELAQTASAWQNFRLPYRIDDHDVKRNGFSSKKFCMTMDQDKVIDMLTGENLYSDAGVFVRELLQNSIDAVLMRVKHDKKFKLEDGLIQIETWNDDQGNTWFCIRDNGTGMDEDIIENHFLKVGNSYYTSDRFRYENRSDKGSGYTAISRFGIGILSCFMGDKEQEVSAKRFGEKTENGIGTLSSFMGDKAHTQLKVSTKRFGEKTENGIRLDVTGLRGYYFLCNEKDHKENKRWFPPMPKSPYNEELGYRTEPGTTICVNANLIRMGEPRSFREILDEYVQFPEIRVTYNGPEGYKEYPTQQELMAAVYALNPDGKIRKYVYELPDENFEELKRSFPYHIFEERPRVILRYEPLDRLSDSEKLTGVKIWAEVTEPKVRIREMEDQELRKALEGSRMVMSGSIHEAGVWIQFDINGVSSHIPRWKTVPGGIVLVKLAAGEQSLLLSPEEKRLWELCFGAIRGSKAKRRLIAYNGVLAQSDQDTSVYDYDSCFVILLREEFLPWVNMARNEITGIPTEAACCMAMAGLEDAVPGNLWKLATEWELWVILDRHPGWTGMLQEKELSIEWRLSLKDTLWLAYWKRQCQVSLELRYFELYTNPEEKPDGRTADFPAAMFYRLDGDVLCCTWHTDSYYDPSHPFSRWLIEHRAALEEQVPNLNDTMIKTMMLTDDRDKIRDVLNNSLELLRKMEGNPFRVPANLILTEEDFI